MIWLPMVYTGLSDAIGPGYERDLAAAEAAHGRPGRIQVGEVRRPWWSRAAILLVRRSDRSAICPPTILPGFGTIRRMDRA